MLFHVSFWPYAPKYALVITACVLISYDGFL